MAEHIKLCKGDCLESLGVPDYCRIVYDDSLLPEVGDIVACSSEFGSMQIMLKQLLSKATPEEKAFVYTSFSDPRKNFGFYTPKIYGVLIKCLETDSEKVVWDQTQILERTWSNDRNYLCPDCKRYFHKSKIIFNGMDGACEECWKKRNECEDVI